MSPNSKTQLRALRQRRAIPSAVALPSWLGQAILGVVGIGVWGLLYMGTHSWLWATGLLAALVGWISFSMQMEHRRLKALMASRPGESICGFARFFPRRTVDPVLLRAVYEEIQRNLLIDAPVPIRATDRLTTDLRLDPDTIDEIYWEVADTCGYDTENVVPNPFRDKVETVADFVHFLQYQPRISSPCHS